MGKLIKPGEEPTFYSDASNSSDEDEDKKTQWKNINAPFPPAPEYIYYTEELKTYLHYWQNSKLLIELWLNTLTEIKS